MIFITGRMSCHSKVYLSEATFYSLVDSFQRGTLTRLLRYRWLIIGPLDLQAYLRDKREIGCSYPDCPRAMMFHEIANKLTAHEWVANVDVNFEACNFGLNGKLCGE